MGVRVVVAPDKFKGSLTAAAVAEAVTRGIHAVAPSAEVVAFPIADGGDGTVEFMLSHGFSAARCSAT
ncbi:MAG: glycerate kinase, partial [Candidatus Nanopelagicales bacterium]